MRGYEILLFSDQPEPIFKAWRNSEGDALAFARKELKAGRGGVYNAAIWNNDPAAFFILYINDQGEIFTSQDPLILTRKKATQLRRRPLDEGPTPIKNFK